MNDVAVAIAGVKKAIEIDAGNEKYLNYLGELETDQTGNE
jgi:hypothetical protein